MPSIKLILVQKLELSGAINYGPGSFIELFSFFLFFLATCLILGSGRCRGWHRKAITSCVFPINQCLPHNLLSVNWDWPVSRVTCQFQLQSACIAPRSVLIPSVPSEWFHLEDHGCIISLPARMISFLRQGIPSLWNRAFKGGYLQPLMVALCLVELFHG